MILEDSSNIRYSQHDREKTLDDRIYLLGSNQQALAEVISLWDRYRADPQAKLERGLAKWNGHGIADSLR